MRFSIVAIASVLASIVYAQSIQQDTLKLPACSLSCLSNAIVSNDCSLTDYVCQCGAHRNAIAQAATPCIVSSCNITEALTVQKIVQDICSLALAGVSSSTSAGSAATTGAPVVATSSSTVSGMGSQMVSSIGSSMYAAPTVTTPTTASTTPTSSSSSSSSNPAQPSAGAGSRLEAASVMACAAFLFALAL